jgi:hypothetical protein
MCINALPSRLDTISGAVVVAIVFIERSQRRLIQYPKRQMGNRMLQGTPRICP